MNTNVVDPVEMVKDLADKIGIHQLYAIVRDMRGEGAEIDLRQQIEELRSHIDYLEHERAKLEGEIQGLRFAVRCNGVSGAEVKQG